MRRDALPMLPELNRYGTEEDFGIGGTMYIAGMRDGKLLVVGGTWMTEIDTDSGEVGPTVGLGLGSDPNSVLGQVGRITSASVRRRDSSVWVRGRSGFARLDMERPGRFVEAVDLDDDVLSPVRWFGDVIVTSSSADYLRFYRLIVQAGGRSRRSSRA